LQENKNKKPVEEITYKSFGSKQVNEQLVGDFSYIYVDKQECKTARSQWFVSIAVGRNTTNSFSTNMTSHYLMCSVLLLASGCVLGRSADNHYDNALPEDEPRTLAENEDASTSLLGTDFRFLFRIYNDCSQKDLSFCLKMKLVTALDRASKSHSDLKLFEGVTFTRDPSAVSDASVNENPISEAELEASLPRGLQDKEDLLDGLIMEKFLAFFKSHVLQFKLPSVQEYQRGLTEEGN
jgi:hypothetical protein